MLKRTSLKTIFNIKRIWSKHANALLSGITFVGLTFLVHHEPVEHFIESLVATTGIFSPSEVLDDLVVGLIAWGVYIASVRFRADYVPPIRITEHDVSTAIDEGRLEVALQPIYNLHTNTIDGFESLVRLHHDAYGVVLPHSFNKLTDFVDSTVAHRITHFVLDRSADYYQQFRKDGYDFQMAVNLFPSDLADPSLIDQISRVTVAHDMPPDRLTVEVSEAALAPNIDISYKIIAGLETLDVKLALDDYGSRITSFVYFNDTLADSVKLDKSLVEKLNMSDANIEHVQSIIYSVHSMGASVTAKHIENQNTVTILRKIECDYVQGYIIAPPMTFDQARGWLKTQRTQKPQLL